MNAGIVIYRRQGTSLAGQWTHEQIGGALATELVSDVPPGPLTGTWPVQIFNPDGSLEFTGRLRSVGLGSSLSLTWEGKFAGQSGQPAKLRRHWLPNRLRPDGRNL
jgi:hypothetical protein